MDVSVLKTLLASQEQAYRGALEVYIGQTNDKINALQSTIKEVTQSLEFTQQEVDQLKQQVVKLEAGKTKHTEVANGMKEELQAMIKQRMRAPQHEVPTRTSHSSRPSSLNHPPPGGRDSESEAWPPLSVPGAVSSVDSAVGVLGSPAGVAAVVAAPDVTAMLGAVGGSDVAMSPSPRSGVCSDGKKDVPSLPTARKVNTRMSSRPHKK
ncbi:hypothetical protein Pmani_007829 [Petrolisthes manimaculis]|uniref:Uncharacterized protein n=1 Tax=Petrolisthes manimaculis TaxID=1843537 RepID=A0AAE1UEE1_9EUCA|nr:hypothetical protein Pmani_007829 [Petrolisthes manimaculis]